MKQNTFLLPFHTTHLTASATDNDQRWIFFAFFGSAFAQISGKIVSLKVKTLNGIINNYSSSQWAIESEAMRARGIIVLVKSN